MSWSVLVSKKATESSRIKHHPVCECVGSGGRFVCVCWWRTWWLNESPQQQNAKLVQIIHELGQSPKIHSANINRITKLHLVGFSFSHRKTLLLTLKTPYHTKWVILHTKKSILVARRHGHTTKDTGEHDKPKSRHELRSSQETELCLVALTQRCVERKSHRPPFGCGRKIGSCAIEGLSIWLREAKVRGAKGGLVSKDQILTIKIRNNIMKRNDIWNLRNK